MPGARIGELPVMGWPSGETSGQRRECRHRLVTASGRIVTFSLPASWRTRIVLPGHPPLSPGCNETLSSGHSLGDSEQRLRSSIALSAAAIAGKHAYGRLDRLRGARAVYRPLDHGADREGEHPGRGLPAGAEWQGPL